MDTITICGNNRFKILQDFNNDLFDKKYLKLKKNGNLVIRVFNKCEFQELETQKYSYINGNYIIYHIIYKDYKPHINIIYNTDDFIPYYILYPEYQNYKSDTYSNKYYLTQECKHIVSVFKDKISKIDTDKMYYVNSTITEPDKKYCSGDAGVKHIEKYCVGSKANTDEKYCSNENILTHEQKITFNFREFKKQCNKNELLIHSKKPLMESKKVENNLNMEKSKKSLKMVSDFIHGYKKFHSEIPSSEPNVCMSNTDISNTGVDDEYDVISSHIDDTDDGYVYDFSEFDII